MDFKKLPRICTIQQINRKIKNYQKVYNYWIHIWKIYKKMIYTSKLLRGIARQKIRYLNMCCININNLLKYNCLFYQIPRLVKKVQVMQRILSIFQGKIWCIRDTLKQVVNGSQ